MITQLQLPAGAKIMPDFMLSVEDKALERNVSERVMSLKMTDNSGFAADMLNITFDDSDGAFQMPERGTVLSLSLGWAGKFGTETITLTGQLLPEVTGGQTYLQVFESMADSGRAWPLIEGSGTIYGMFVVQSFNHTNSQLNTDGRARNISFELTLKRVDESYAAMFGDLQEQAKGLYNKASNTVKQLFPNGVSL